MKFIFKIIVGFFLFLTASNAVVIKDIQVNNNKRITKETIITYGAIKLNKDYNQNELNRIIKDLYDTNFFKKISLDVDGQTLVLNIVENKLSSTPKVKAFSDNPIREVIVPTLYRSSIFDVNKRVFIPCSP